MTANTTLICFLCHYTAKASFPLSERRCPTCRATLRDVGKRFPVPPKADVEGWQKAEAKLNRIEATNKDMWTEGYWKRQEARKILAAKRKA